MDNTEIAISLDRKTLERMDGLHFEKGLSQLQPGDFRRPWPRSSRAWNAAVWRPRARSLTSRSRKYLQEKARGEAE
jgi:hypothetical protein